MEAEEKARLEEEINAKAEEVAEIQNAVRFKFFVIFKVEKILKCSLDLIPSPSVKV